MREHAKEFEVRVMARLLEISESGYYAWFKQSQRPQGDADYDLIQEMLRLRSSSRDSYGYRQMWQKLRHAGYQINRKRVQRIMREQGWVVKAKRRTVRTTNSLHSYPIAPNRLNRDFSATGMNQKWLSDITYVQTMEGWLYVCAVLDVFSGRIVGWAARADMSEDLVLDALKMAFEQRQPAPGLIVHTDRGVQFAARAYVNLLATHHALQSMSRKGDCYDNAMMESWNARYKVEWLPEQTYVSRSLAKLDVFEYIEVHYNRRRPKARLGGLSPAQFEAKYLAEFRK